VNKIKEYRRKLGLTQIELARACNVSQGALSGYETGRYEPDMATMRRLAQFFDVSLDELFGFDGPEEIMTPEMSEIEYALSGEIRNLSEDEMQDVLEYVRFKRAQKLKRQ
jgi:transcriptional regulator with XRE-family HTH domain